LQRHDDYPGSFAKVASCETNAVSHPPDDNCAGKFAQFAHDIEESVSQPWFNQRENQRRSAISDRGFLLSDCTRMSATINMLIDINCISIFVFIDKGYARRKISPHTPNRMATRSRFGCK
jgi:hypothetical protein